MAIGKLCDVKKDQREKLWDQLSAMVAEPKFMCRKCLRVCDRPRHLCKPEKLPQR
ncbi:MAG: hypothetical protein PF961_17670 [Planctomycetota bacterium]|jgi:hypothetical protein|nr:hypothetical protein [Planctomycetota bacterium]